MDPRTACRGQSQVRFPRTRGDGPRDDRAVVDAQWFPPHARGWTDGAVSGLADRNVSPARAGMDPDRPVRSSRRHGFPRTRGDGPVQVSPLSVCRTFPPHARGWTPIRLDALDALGVSPARAGMDRHRSTRSWVARGFPRTRGDGPAPHGDPDMTPEFPPHARGWTRA